MFKALQLLIFTLLSAALGKYSRRRRNPSQHIFITSEEKPKDVTLLITPPKIRIFVKGLRNAHMLATHVYEKGLQTLADAITEVEKLQATR